MLNVVDDCEMTDEQIYQAALEEWLGVLSQLWIAVGKSPTPEQLSVYQDMLGDIPLGLLETSVRHALQAHQYASVPTIGNVWDAFITELKPEGRTIREAVNLWADREFERIVYRFQE